MGPSLIPSPKTLTSWFIKAFFSQGMEQLLWHISTIEALLGEKAEGLTNRLARRSALIIAKEREDREIIRKKFKELYDFDKSIFNAIKPKLANTFIVHQK